jgi:rhodanese-related sulfurtransferase
MFYKRVYVRIFFSYGFLSVTLFLTGCFVLQQKEVRPLVINVSEKTLYDDCHIPFSVHVPFDKVEAYVRSVPKDTHIIVYCSNYACSTSHFVVQKLREKGYTQAYVYAGGMTEWFLAGRPVEGKASADYLKKEIAIPDHESSGLPTISEKELASILKIV